AEDGHLRIRLAGCEEDKQTVASARPVDAPSPPRSLGRAPRPPRLSTVSACAPSPPTWSRQTPGESRAAAPRPRE
ncbi:hypothetical protein T492DRAFT_960217, partial [Pavlovales sp. CCMP2436]